MVFIDPIGVRVEPATVSMRGYFAYVYANGAHVELSELQKAQ